MGRELQDRPFRPSTIGTIDEAVYNYINEDLNLFLNTAEGRKKVPVLWQTAERTFQIKNNLESRDSAGKLILPVISITRDSIEKDPSFKGKVQAHIYEDNTDQGGSIIIGRKILSKKTTDHQVSQVLKSTNTSDRFKPVAQGKVLYEEIRIPVPVYVKMMYTINLRTEYLQQMNELISPFIAKTGQIWSFIIEHENHRYEAFIEQDISDNKNTSSLGTEERKFESQVKLKVLGYLTNEGENRKRPYYSKKETKVSIMLRERIVTSIPTGSQNIVVNPGSVEPPESEDITPIDINSYNAETGPVVFGTEDED